MFRIYMRKNFQKNGKNAKNQKNIRINICGKKSRRDGTKKGENAVNKKCVVTGLLTAFALMLSACSFGSGNVDASGSTEGQTSRLGINSKSKGFEAALTDDTFYVVQNGIYYPINTYVRTEEDAPRDNVDPSRMWFYTSDSELDIPVLYDDCELVYYSKSKLLDYITWERLYDLEYTIGVFNIQSMVSGRQYIKVGKSDEPCMLAGVEMEDIYNLGVDQVLLDKIGRTKIVPDMVEDGIIKGTKKDEPYDLEIYTGSTFKHYTALANMHAFKAYELFASIEYETLQDYFYRVEIPEYFVSGYYEMNGRGVVKIVKGDNDTEFNEQLLFPDTPSYFYYEEDDYISPAIYSTYEPLNKFSCSTEGALGYVPPDFVEVEGEEANSDESNLIQATQKTVELWLPKKTDCTIVIVSETGETTGDITLKLGEKQKPVAYNRIEDNYSYAVVGKGQRATLVVKGLFDNYKIKLNGAEVYNGQDVTEESTEESEE